MGPNGFAEQDPADYWKAVCAATKAVVKKVGIAEKDVVGMSFSTQGLGIIPIDAQGNILHNNISWIDSRARKQADEINEKMGSQEFGATDVIPKYLWIKQNMPTKRPEIFTFDDWHAHSMTAVVRDTKSVR